MSRAKGEESPGRNSTTSSFTRPRTRAATRTTERESAPLTNGGSIEDAIPPVKCSGLTMEHSFRKGTARNEGSIEDAIPPVKYSGLTMENSLRKGTARNYASFKRKYLDPYISLMISSGYHALEKFELLGEDGLPSKEGRQLCIGVVEYLDTCNANLSAYETATKFLQFRLMQQMQDAGTWNRSTFGGFIRNIPGVRDVFDASKKRKRNPEVDGGIHYALQCVTKNEKVKMCKAILEGDVPGDHFSNLQEYFCLTMSYHTLLRGGDIRELRYGDLCTKHVQVVGSAGVTGILLPLKGGKVQTSTGPIRTSMIIDHKNPILCAKGALGMMFIGEFFCLRVKEAPDDSSERGGLAKPRSM